MVAEPQHAGRFDIGAIYQAHRRVLVGTAVRRFGIAETDAEPLVHDVFLSYLLKADDVIDPGAWLIGAICNASRYFLRVRAREAARMTGFTSATDPSSLRLVDEPPDGVVTRECFACLTARCQLTLRLRYLEGYSVPEIAEELQTSAKYAQKLVSRCLQQANDRYGGKGVAS